MIGYNNLIGNVPRLTTPVTGAATVAGEILYIPLEFWFNRNAGLKRVGPQNGLFTDNLLVRKCDKTKLRETLYTKNTSSIMVKILSLDNPQPKPVFPGEAQRLNSFGGVT